MGAVYRQERADAEAGTFDRRGRSCCESLGFRQMNHELSRKLRFSRTIKDSLQKLGLLTGGEGSGRKNPDSW